MQVCDMVIRRYRVHVSLELPVVGRWYIHAGTDMSAKWFWGVLRLQMIVLGLGLEIHVTPPDAPVLAWENVSRQVVPTNQNRTGGV